MNYNNINKDGMERLFAAICGQAAADYRSVLRGEVEPRTIHEKDPSPYNGLEILSREELEEFFTGEWFAAMSRDKIDGNYVIAALQKEVAVG